MALTDTKVRNAKPEKKQIKLFDGDGLFLLISPPGKRTPNGSRCWRFKYRFNGKEKLLALGTYPEVSLSDARDKRTEARRQIAAGIDPSEARKAQKAADAEQEATFELVAREWLKKFGPTWSEGHVANIVSRLGKNVYPWIGSRPIAEIEPTELLSVLRRIEDRNLLNTAHRVQAYCGQIFRYAIATGRAKRDIAADLKGALPPVAVTNQKAITDPKELVGLLRAMDGYKGSFVVKSAMYLGALTAVRPGELRQAEWTEIDFEAAEWNIPEEKMKMGKPHIVPLSRQALEILEEIKPLSGSGKYVFPNARMSSRPMSDSSIVAALSAMGYRDRHSGHGWRATFRTILDEVLQVRPDFIEHQLAHAVRDPNGRAYNRTAHLEARREMMQTWADYLDGLKAGAKVLPLKKAE